MAIDSLEAKIRRHWTTYLPQKVAELRAAGTLNEEIQGAARLAQAEIETLKKAGYQDHEAEEVALHRFVYLKPEPGAGIPKDQQAESAELERAYRANPPV